MSVTNLTNTQEKQSNIWRVDRESHIDKIINNNRDKIVMVTFAYEEPRLKIFLKREMAVNFPNCTFVLAIMDIPGGEKKSNFLADKLTYMQKLNGKQLPYICFYYDANWLCEITAAEPAVIINTLAKLVVFANKSQQDGKQTGANNQAKVLHTKLAHEYQIERMAQQKKLHDLEELQKMQKIKEDKYEKIDKESDDDKHKSSSN